MKNVYLIGMMGSGKTTTASELAKLLGMQAVDLDELICEEAGKSVNDIFQDDGEPAFRALETKVLEDVASRSGQIVGTGGGVVISPKNVRRMRETGILIYLKTDLNVLWERIKHKKDRPLLKSDSPQETLQALLKVRSPLYEQASAIIVMTDGKTPKQVAEDIHRRHFAK